MPLKAAFAALRELIETRNRGALEYLADLTAELEVEAIGIEGQRLRRFWLWPLEEGWIGSRDNNQYTVGIVRIIE